MHGFTLHDGNFNLEEDTLFLQFIKVHIFWEDHKILRNLLHQLFDWQYIGQIMVEILQNFVAFSEYMNFK